MSILKSEAGGMIYKQCLVGPGVFISNLSAANGYLAKILIVFPRGRVEVNSEDK